LSDVLHGLVVGFWVVLDRDLSGHASHGVYASAMASLDQETNISVHEWTGHGDGGSIWKDEARMLTELLNHGEDIIPSSTVEAGGVIPQFIDDLIHLEGGGDGFNQYGSSDGAAGHANVILGQVEDVIPQPGLEMGFHLWEIEIRASPSLDKLKGIVEKV
jgi:hypothetical protein